VLTYGRLTRVLFYLPAVTPWWFEEIIMPMVRTLSHGAQVHVMVPPLWRGTGIGREQANAIRSVSGVFWHLLDEADPLALRVDARGEAQVRELIAQIAPDIVLCRSADVATPRSFPGTVRFIMEGGGAPLGNGLYHPGLAETLFDFGIMPQLTADQCALLDQAGRDLFADRAPALTFDSRAKWRRRLGLPEGKTLYGVPLEYEHEENFFSAHHPYRSNAQLLRTLADKAPDDAIFLVSHHPLTERHGDTSEVNSLVADLRGRAILVEQEKRAGFATWHMCKHCDAMIFQNTKSWSVAAAYGTPILRLSRYRMGEWVRAYREIEPFFEDVGHGRAQAAGETEARRWFAYHVASFMFYPRDPALTASELIDRAVRPHSPETWARRIADYRARGPAAAARAAAPGVKEAA